MNNIHNHSTFASACVIGAASGRPSGTVSPRI